MKTKVNKLEKSMIEIEAELDADIFENYFKIALDKISKEVKIDGFREGKAPEKMVLSQVPEMQILEEAAQIALTEHYPKILKEEKIDAITQPEINIIKIGRKNPLVFKIKTATLPEFDLPEYKKIAKKINEKAKKEEKNIEATDEEVEATIKDIQRSRAPKVDIKDKAKEDAKGDKDAETKQSLPELTDEFVKGLGPFENVADFKKKLKENITLEKKNREKEMHRTRIMEEVIEKTKIEVPEALTSMEVDKIIYKMEADISRMGMKFEEYLTQMKKTKEDLRKEFEGEAEKRAKLALILSKIAKSEEIKPDEEKVKQEMDFIMKTYSDADESRARNYAENVLINEEIFKLLEEA